MVMESGSTLIVMLGALAERGRPKCHQYWAGMGRALKPGGSTGPRVQTLAELPDPSAACIHRHLLITVIIHFYICIIYSPLFNYF